jgi:hypothetical protein
MAQNAPRNPTISRILRSPLVLAPALAGIAAAVPALWQGKATGLLSLLGVAGLCFAAGSAVTQFVAGKWKIGKPGHNDPSRTARNKHEAYLTDLMYRLRRDRDDRTEDMLDRLHRLNDRLQISGLLDGNAGPMPEIREKVKQLYRSCLRSLERSWEFWSAATEMSTQQVRQEMLERRERILAEVRDSTGHLETTVDYLRAKQLERTLDEAELSRIRRELDVGLRAARRVEEQMSDLEDGLTARLGNTLE